MGEVPKLDDVSTKIKLSTLCKIRFMSKVKMASGECNRENNLSESLSRNEKEKLPPTCENNDLVSGYENCPHVGIGDDCLKKKQKRENFYDDDNNDSGCDEIEKQSSIGECCSKSEDVVDKETINSSEIKYMGRQSKSVAGITIAETFNEEDEIEKESSEEEENYESAEELLTPEEAEERLKEAMELKTKGNDHFRKQEYVEGKDLYSRAIKRCPKEFTENKAVFLSNRAACFQKMENYESAASDCSKALELNTKYPKARLRRAQCYEKLDKLEEALEDYKIVFENDRSNQTARDAIMRLPEEIKVKHEKLKEEMIGKLKDLGNMVLRPFGLSTDNFKLQQDPNSGGYSVNFQQ